MADVFTTQANTVFGIFSEENNSWSFLDLNFCFFLQGNEGACSIQHHEEYLFNEYLEKYCLLNSFAFSRHVLNYLNFGGKEKQNYPHIIVVLKLFI